MYNSLEAFCCAAIDAVRPRPTFLYRDSLQCDAQAPQCLRCEGWEKLIFERLDYGKCPEAKHRPLCAWEFCVHELKREKTSNRAILRFDRPRWHYFGCKNPIDAQLAAFIVAPADRLNLAIVESRTPPDRLAHRMGFYNSLVVAMCNDLKTHYQLQPGSLEFFTFVME